MGALHAGHISLIKECQRVADYTVISIFVNPLQFNKKEDLDIQIYNTIGLLIYEDRIKTVENEVTIDVKNLSPGMYMIKISNGKHSSSTTWIKK